MCEFSYAGVVGGDYEPYLKTHPKTREILAEMQKTVASVLGTPYWSVIPFAFGEKKFVKYKLLPAEWEDTRLPKSAFDDPGYLAADLERRLAEKGAVFHFYAQFQTAEMPLDRATVRWDEAASPLVHLATLTLPRQDIRARGQASYGENLAFNPWHALSEHAPVGSIAEARREVYAAAADFRRNANGVPLSEPAEVRPLEALPQPQDLTVVRAAIHPSIGIARVGNSVSEFFLAPEVPDPPPSLPGTFKDATGSLKRQAVRFRVYGYNAAGEVVAELTSDSADISWTVHVANTKAVWYQFQIALDIPEAAAAADPVRQFHAPAQTLKVPVSSRRNAAEVDRSKLIIDPGPRTVRGPNKVGPEYAFDTGKFYDKPVYLGELQTDDKGRLVVLGGRGVSASYDNSEAETFANNDKWHDDVADGPVSASVSIGGRQIPVAPAWIVVAPPNYAPDLKGVRTLYDLLEDVFIQVGWLWFPATVSFAQHIYPILERMNRLQWVNRGFAESFGWGAPQDFLQPDYLRRLASPDPTDAEVRRQVYNAFRQPERDGLSPLAWPWIYGDAMNVPAVSPRQYATLTATQLRLLSQWAAGRFIPGEPVESPKSLDEVPLADQPETLDRASLSFCLADAFHPGCEVTWVIRHASMYSAPFRIRHRAAGDPEPDWGPTLKPEIALSVNGPLYAAASRRAYALDGGAVADGYFQLSVRLRGQVRPEPPHVLARACAESGALA